MHQQYSLASVVDTIPSLEADVADTILSAYVEDKPWMAFRKADSNSHDPVLFETLFHLAERLRISRPHLVRDVGLAAYVGLENQVTRNNVVHSTYEVLPIIDRGTLYELTLLNIKRDFSEFARYLFEQDNNMWFAAEHMVEHLGVPYDAHSCVGMVGLMHYLLSVQVAKEPIRKNFNFSPPMD